jgi:hypothetical protein
VTAPTYRPLTRPELEKALADPKVPHRSTSFTVALRESGLTPLEGLATVLDTTACGAASFDVPFDDLVAVLRTRYDRHRTNATAAGIPLGTPRPYPS